MKIISAKTSERVCKHMNNDHVESVHKYLKYYGKISEFKEAYLEAVSYTHLTLPTICSV